MSQLLPTDQQQHLANDQGADGVADAGANSMHGQGCTPVFGENVEREETAEGCQNAEDAPTKHSDSKTRT